MHQCQRSSGAMSARNRLARASIPFLTVCATLFFGGAAPAHSQATANALVPAQAPAKEALASIADTHLWYWDTGGEGAPVVLLHPASGSGLIWGYQQSALAKAGLPRHRLFAAQLLQTPTPWPRTIPASGPRTSTP